MKTQMDMHAGETETSLMLIARPTWCIWTGRRMNRARTRSAVAAGLGLYGHLVVCALSHHYSGEGAAGNKELGEFEQKEWSRQIAEALKAIKADQESLKLQTSSSRTRSIRWTRAIASATRDRACAP